MASPPSRPKRLVPGWRLCTNFSKLSPSISFFRIARLPSGVKAISLSGPSMRSWIQLFSAGSVMCMNSTPTCLAIGALQDREHLVDGGGLKAEHAVDEDRPIEIVGAEAVARRIEFRRGAARTSMPSGSRLRGQVPARAIGADHHQRAHAIARGRLHVLRRGARQARGDLAVRAWRSSPAQLPSSSAVVSVVFGCASSGRYQDGPATAAAHGFGIVAQLLEEGAPGWIDRVGIVEISRGHLLHERARWRRRENWFPAALCSASCGRHPPWRR